MLRGLTYRKKNKLLLITAALLLLITYSLSVSRTIDTISEANALEQRAMLAASAPGKVAELEGKIKSMDGILSETQGVNVQQSLLESITGYCRAEQTTLREFPSTIYHEEKDMVVETNVFTVEGSFKQLLRLVYLLEQKNKLGKVSSARYFARKDPKTKTTALNVTIYLQNINKHDHEK